MQPGRRLPPNATPCSYATGQTCVHKSMLLSLLFSFCPMHLQGVPGICRYVIRCMYVSFAQLVGCQLNQRPSSTYSDFLQILHVFFINFTKLHMQNFCYLSQIVLELWHLEVGKIGQKVWNQWLLKLLPVWNYSKQHLDLLNLGVCNTYHPIFRFFLN